MDLIYEQDELNLLAVIVYEPKPFHQFEPMLSNETC